MSRHLLRRIAARLRRDRLDDELAEEMRLHVELRRQALEADGMTPDDAHREARRQFGNIARLKEESWDMWGFPAFESVVQDLSYGARLLRRSPLFALTAALSLAIGIGATAAVFGLADTLLFRTLPVRAPEDLVVLKWRSGPVFPLASLHGHAEMNDSSVASTSFSYQAYARARAETTALLDVFAFADLYQVSVTVGDRTEVSTGHAVSGNYFPALGVSPALGRPLVDGDDRAGSPPAAVASHAFWQQRLGGGPDAIGRQILVNGLPFSIVGVLPPAFTGTGQVGDAPGIFVPLAFHAAVARITEPMDDPNVWWVLMMARLRPGASRAGAESALDLILKQTVATARPGMDPKDLPRMDLLPGARGQVEIRDSMREPLRMMTLVVAIVLIVACANVANLLLARGRARMREVTVRVAMGASRRRVVRQMLTEGLLLAALGSAAGLVAAQWFGAALLPALQEGSSELAVVTGVTLRSVAFAVCLTSLCTVLFALFPAVRATDVSLAAGLHEAARGASAGRRRRGLSSSLVVAQIALSMVLVVTALLLIRSVRQLQHTELGFDPRSILLFRIDATQTGYEEPRVRQTYDALLERLRRTPGVTEASFTSHTLVSYSSAVSAVTRLDEVAPDPASAEAAPFRQSHRGWRLTVDHRFFDTFRLPLLRGRNLGDQDTPVSQRVAVINRLMAQQLFGTEDAVGRRFRMGMTPSSPVYEVVGIAADARYTAVREPKRPTIYLSARQHPAGPVTFAVRTAGDPEAFAPTVREIVRSVDGSLPPTAVRSQEAQVAMNLQREILFARLAAWLGAVTLALSAIGLYALQAYAVTRRTGEIGIRIALGAGRAAVRWMVLRHALTLAALGLALGAAGAIAGTRLVEALLYNVAPRDPVTLIAAALVMLLVSLLAGYLPARRASRVDPVVALRAD